MSSPPNYYDFVLPDIGSTRGAIKYLVYDDFLVSANGREEKIPGNCYKYWFNKDRSFGTVQGYFDTIVFFTYKFIYDKNSRLEKIVVQKGKSADSTVYSYDNNALLRSQHVYKSGKITRKKVINYDSLSRRSQTYEFSDYQSSILGTRYYYTSSSINSDSVILSTGAKIIYKYSDGLLVKADNYGMNGMHWNSQYKYNKTGDVTWQLESLNGEPTTFKYTYDSRGNWTRKVTVQNGKEHSAVVRSIEYY